MMKSFKIFRHRQSLMKRFILDDETLSDEKF